MTEMTKQLAKARNEVERLNREDPYNFVHLAYWLTECAVLEEGIEFHAAMYCSPV